MYCGDETGAFIGEISTHTIKFGYGGEDNPKYVAPSHQHPDCTIPTSTLHAPPASGDIVPIFHQPQGDLTHPENWLEGDGIVENWDAYENAWTKAFEVLRVRDEMKHSAGGGGRSSSAEDWKCSHPLLAVTPGHTFLNKAEKGTSAAPDVAPDSHQFQTAIHRAQQTRMTEILFESLDAPAVFLAPAPMLAAFANGRQTGLVVDVGGSGTRVTPIVDGLILRNSQRRSGRGGEWLSEVQRRVLEDLVKVDVKPRYVLRSKREQLKETMFHKWAMRDAMYEMKTGPHVELDSYREDTSVPFVVDEKKDPDAMDVEEEKGEEEEEEDDEDDDGMKAYELPDGTKVDLVGKREGRDLCRLPELFFTDQVPFSSQKLPAAMPPPTTTSSVTQQTLSNLPLHKLVQASLTAVSDSDARKELCGNILLTGSSSLFPNMEARLSYEMTNTVPSTYKCRVIASRNSMERRYAAWIGGSVLTSLGSFQQLWLSKAEYEEYGVTLGVQRFP